MYKTRAPVHVHTAEYAFEHSLDTHKLVFAAGWFVASAILYVNVIIELVNTSLIAQTFDTTFISSDKYIALLAVGFIGQLGFEFCTGFTATIRTSTTAININQISLWLCASNAVVGVIHFGIESRGVFSFVVIFLVLNTITWLLRVYSCYVVYVRRQPRTFTFSE